MLCQSQKLFGERNAFLIKEKDDKYKGITFTEFKNDVDALGTAFLSLGLKDAFIAVMGENRYEWCLTYLATVNGTGVIVPLDRELPADEIQNLLHRSGAQAIVYSGKHDEAIQNISSSLPCLKYLINMDATEDSDNCLSLRKLVEKGKALIKSGDRSYIDARIDPDALSVLIFTSGTTGIPKGVMLSHTNICANMMAVCSALYIDSSDSALSILPLHHTYECTAGFLVMTYNGCAVSFNEGLKHISKNLRETRPSILMLVPLIIENMYRKIWEQARKKKTTYIKLKTAIFISDLLYNVFGLDIRKKLFRTIHESIGGRVRLIISGAAALDPEVSKGLRSLGITVRQGYGLTECSPIVTVNRDHEFKDSSIGLPLPGVDVKIVNPNEEGIGELAVKGDNVMLGYYNNPEETQKVLRDGWLYTGDLGYCDDDGFFYITGRKKNVIVTKNGKNIYPEELEALLAKSPYILESMITGEEEEDGDVKIKAIIVPNADEIKLRLKQDEISQEEIHKLISNEVKAINRGMPIYKKINKIVIREEEFQKTTTRKIKRYTVS